jgi:hypothetical protein
MMSIFRPFIVRFVVVYFDDIFIYKTNLDEHLQHLCEVIIVLLREKFFATIAKCSFMTDYVLFLGLCGVKRWFVNE